MRFRFLVVISSLSVSSGIAFAETPGSTLSDEKIRQACKVMAQLGERPASCLHSRATPGGSPAQVVAVPPPVPVKAMLLVPSVPPSAAAVAAAEAEKSREPFWLLRQDQYDQISYVIPPQAYQVLEGASVSYTNDQIAKTQSLTTKGFLGYSAYHWQQQPASGCGSSGGPTVLNGLGIGPFIQADGTLSEPTNANEKSALRVGINSDFHLCDTAAFHQEDWQFL